jgi:hypothetical protein
MSLREDIRRLYRDNPGISGKEISRLLGRSDRAFWRTLNHEQVTMRGGPTIAKSKSGHRYNARSKGNVYFIPPKNEVSHESGAST